MLQRLASVQRTLRYFEAVILEAMNAPLCFCPGFFTILAVDEALWGHRCYSTPTCTQRSAASVYLGSVQPLQLLLLGLSPCCPLHTSRQLGAQLLFCVGSGLERARESS